MTGDPRRQKPIKIHWDGIAGHLTIGYLTIDDESWGAVEWSPKRKAWCIQDAEGRCLSHHSHIHGEDKDKAGAIALAEAMVRDGRMPSPEDARSARKARLQRDRERRAKQPAEIRKRAERDETERLFREHCETENADGDAEPLYEAIADTLDFNDPELWKSNSFARLRLRLIVNVRAAIADFEYSLRRPWRDPETVERLARAREILALLRPDGAS
jgi:hypothetical protein